MITILKYSNAQRGEVFKYVANTKGLHPGGPLVRVASTPEAVLMSIEDVRDLSIFAWEMEQWLTRGKPSKPRVQIGPVRAWRALRNHCETLTGEPVVDIEQQGEAFDPALPMRWYSPYYEKDGVVRAYCDTGEAFKAMLEADRATRSEAPAPQTRSLWQSIAAWFKGVQHG